MARMLMLKALPDVPRWTVLAAHAVPLLTLPSALWRLALAAGLPVTDLSVRNGWEALYIVTLAVVSEALALLTLGLVRPWGEVVPRWIPLLGGRRVAPLAATVPAVLGGVALVGVIGFASYSYATGGGSEVTASAAQSALLVVCYVPLLAWPPLLIAVAVAYYRRRTLRAPSVAGTPEQPLPRPAGRTGGPAS